VLAQPSEATLLGAFADGWSVAPQQSMLTGATVAPLDPAALSAQGSMAFVTVDNPGEILTGSLNAALAGAAYAGTAASLDGDTLANFTVGDLVDVADLSPAGASLSTDAGGMLIVAGGGQATMFGIAGLAPGASFALGADGHGGTLLRVV
jgi:hypothetical protein